MSAIHTSINLIRDLQRQIRHLNAEVKDAKVSLFKEILSDMGPENTVASGAVTLNFGRITQIYR